MCHRASDNLFQDLYLVPATLCHLQNNRDEVRLGLMPLPDPATRIGARSVEITKCNILKSARFLHRRFSSRNPEAKQPGRSGFRFARESGTACNPRNAPLRPHRARPRGCHRRIGVARSSRRRQLVADDPRTARTRPLPSAQRLTHDRRHQSDHRFPRWSRSRRHDHPPHLRKHDPRFLQTRRPPKSRSRHNRETPREIDVAQALACSVGFSRRRPSFCET